MRIIFILLLSILVTGCNFLPKKFAEIEKIPVTNPITGNAMLDGEGNVVYTERKTTLPVIMARENRGLLGNETKKKVNPCGVLDFDKIKQANLKASGEAELFRGYFSCLQITNVLNGSTNIVDSALNRPKTDVEAVARSNTEIVASIQNAEIEKTKAITGGLIRAFGFYSAQKAHTASVEAVRDVGLVNKGNVTNVGDITINDSQSVASTTGTGETGTGTATGSISPSSQSNSIVIGDSNNTSSAFDSATSNAQDAHTLYDLEENPSISETSTDQIDIGLID